MQTHGGARRWLTPSNHACPAIPIEAARHLPHVALLLTAHGGHLGFLEGLCPRPGSYMERLFAQFISAVFEHREELQQLEGDGDRDGAVGQGAA